MARVLRGYAIVLVVNLPVFSLEFVVLLQFVVLEEVLAGDDDGVLVPTV